MSTQANTNSMDDLTLLLAACMLALVVSAGALALTGIGLYSAVLTIVVCRFFGRSSIAVLLLLVGGTLLATALWLGPYPAVWRISFPAYKATWDAGTFPIVTALIWLDPTELPFDRLALAAVGMIAGGAFELLLTGRRNSRLLALARAGQTQIRARAPIAAICAWVAPWLPAACRRGYTLLGTRFALGFWLWFSEGDANHHTLIVGTTGKGKTITMSNMIEADIDRGQGVMLADGKGDVEFADRIRQYAEKRGRKVYVFNTLNPNDSCAYNPLSSGDYTAKADRIMRLREYSEPHHEALARSFLQTCCKALAFENRSIDLFQLADVLSVNSLLRLIGRRGFVDPARQALIKEINEQASAEKTSIEGLRADIRFLVGSSIGALFDTQRAEREGRPILDLETARQEGAIVLFLLPPLLFQNSARILGQLIINDCKAVAVTTRSPWKLYMDEFSVFSASNVLNLINMGRTFGVCGTLATQSLADFDAGAPELLGAFGHQVLASVNTVICHQVNDPDDAETLARFLGTSPELELTAQMQGGVFTGQASARAVREFLIYPDQLKNIQKGRAYVINRNNGTSSLLAVRRSSI